MGPGSGALLQSLIIPRKSFVGKTRRKEGKDMDTETKVEGSLGSQGKGKHVGALECPHGTQRAW